MAANIGLNEGQVKASKTVLNNLLSDHFVLLAKTLELPLECKRSQFPFLSCFYGRFV